VFQVREIADHDRQPSAKWALLSGVRWFREWHDICIEVGAMVFPLPPILDFSAYSSSEASGMKGHLGKKCLGKFFSGIAGAVRSLS